MDKARIQVHDFSGHPFQADLSRELARRGYQVDHVFSSQYASGKGRLERAAGDPETLTFTPIETHREFTKYSPVGRARFELAYGSAWTRLVRDTRPDCVIACNVPLLAMNRFRAWAARHEQPWILWHQDIYSQGMNDELDRRLPAPIARVGRSYFTSRERKAASSAAGVIAIGEAFRQVYDEWEIEPSKVEVIPNWAPVDEIKPTERDNRWALENLPSDRGLRLLYAGTLGRKHNPQVLVDLLRGVHAASREAELVVVSEGDGADDIRDKDASIAVLPFQDANDLSEVLGSSDVLVAILEPEASKFSIPSKVLSYMAAGRPILGLMPADNPAAADIRAAGGFVASPDSAGVQASIPWLCSLMDDSELKGRVGLRARRLAEDKFGVEPITDKFVAVVEASIPPAR